MRTTSCYVLGSIAACVLCTTAAIGAEQCYPPQKTCGDNGFNYPCPPCPPRGVHIGSIVAAEKYRESLEKYRVDLEAKRKNDPDGSLNDYRKGLSEYKDGIGEYKQAVEKAGPEQ